MVAIATKEAMAVKCGEKNAAAIKGVEFCDAAV